jgi:hypothetical protein
MQYVTDNERITKIEECLNGNGKEGLKTTVAKQGLEVCEIKEMVRNLTVNISALVRYQTEDETRTRLLSDFSKEKNNRIRWQVVQLIAIASLIIAIFIK